MDDLSKLLLQLGYNTSPSPSESPPPLDEATIRAGLSDLRYRQLIRWLAGEIKRYGEMDGETVSSADDQECFAWEVSAFLKELGCPYEAFVEGPLQQRFLTDRDATALVDYLAGECAALAMLKRKRDQEQARFRVKVKTPCSKTDLLDICEVLNVDLTSFESPTDLFGTICEQLDQRSQTFPKLLFQPTVNLTPDQWTQLEATQADLLEYYSLRQQMMLKRLDVTINAFQWKSANTAEVSREYRQRRRYLVNLIAALTTRDISDLLVTNEQLLVQEKVGSTRIRVITAEHGNTSAQPTVSGKNVYQGVLDLPDRGGRVNLNEKPCMPNWSSREEGQATENLRRKPKKNAEEACEAKPAKTKHKKKNHKPDDIISGRTEIE